MENNSKKAIIELSENKITLVILETKEPCFYNVIDTYSDNIVLAQEIINENLIRPVVIKDVMKILKSYRKICDNLGIVNIVKSFFCYNIVICKFKWISCGFPCKHAKI